MGGGSSRNTNRAVPLDEKIRTAYTGTRGTSENTPSSDNFSHGMGVSIRPTKQGGDRRYRAR